MAQFIVYWLEFVQVNEEDGQLARLSLGSQQSPFDPVGKECPVWQIR